MVSQKKKKTESCHKSKELKESGIDVLYELIDRAKSNIDDGYDLEDAVQTAIDDGLIHTEDICDLAMKYGVIDEGQLISDMYDNLYSDILKEVEEYASEDVEETYHITNMEWDVDGEFDEDEETVEEFMEKNNLQKEFDIDVSYSRGDDVEDVIRDTIEDKYGFNPFKFNFYKKKVDEGLRTKEDPWGLLK